MIKKKNLNKKNISKLIDKDFKDYAIYTLEQRGIPNFDDSLTPVQRIIVENAKVSTEKTLSLVGSAISSGYSHGDSSLGGAISKLAKEFNCSTNLLQGKGFFGNPVVQDAAQPRYTSVKINPIIKSITSEFSYLNEKVDEILEPLHLQIPIGLLGTTIGIAVGYRTLILPRKLEDIKKYMNGTNTQLKPHFKNFTGTVNKFEDGWIIKGKYTVDTKTSTIHITDIPHMIKYPSFVNKLQKHLDDNELKCKIENNSKNSINIKIKVQPKDLKLVKEIVDKITKLIVKESIIFIKGNQVILYKSISDYLDDYKIRLQEIATKNAIFQYNKETFNLSYEEAKLKFLVFMQEKKRKRTDVINFLKKFKSEISTKLDSIKLSSLSDDAIKECKEEITRLKSLKIKLKKEQTLEQKKLEKLNKMFTFSGSVTENKQALFEDEETTINGIDVYNIDEFNKEDNDE